MICRMKDLIELVGALRRGQYTRAELMPRIARLGDIHGAEEVFRELPSDIRITFCEWVRVVPVEGWGAPIGSIGTEPTSRIVAEFKRLAGKEM